MNTRRRFTDSFKAGDTVGITRTRHGWHDGNIMGKIIQISDYSCVVKDRDTGHTYEIEKPRDIFHCC